ncbi:VOC family protein [uncultured Pelagimonas sp.]|uniref:VOC family protein n=1 Tax=uncultured Pelagimonas sp. TaxID=1618102 RepID=UPI00261F72E4|nr:VOC family protein [uncultured Pelagimonas sp.]
MKLGYTIIYVTDVPATVAFYETAFGLKQRFMHDSKTYAEMETGATALAFADESAVELNGLAVAPNRSGALAAAWEICLIPDDVLTAFDRAIEGGATPVAAPQQKPWGQTVAYLRDLNGCIVELASEIDGDNLG